MFIAVILRSGRSPLVKPESELTCHQIRQLASVELRKRVSSGDGKLWKKTPEPVRLQIKQNILQRLTQENA